MERIGVIFGGRSGEHEVSLSSAAAVITAIDKKKYQVVTIGITKEGKWKLFQGNTEHIADGSWEKQAGDMDPGRLKDLIDFALPILHGPYGEDGTIQGLFEMLDIPYGGCGVLSSAMCMDKASAKKMFEKEGLPTSSYTLIYAEDARTDLDEAARRAEKEILYPMFVKPSNMGSSVGISKARDFEQLKESIILASKYDRRIIVEEGINCREVETGVIGNHRPEVAGVGEIVAAQDFYDYEAKYSDNAGTELSIPADLSEDICKKIRTLAKRAYMALDCSGFARVDFFVDKESGEVYINEINTIPGFTRHSLFPLIWKEAGVSFGELIERIVELGYERYNSKNSR